MTRTFVLGQLGWIMEVLNLVVDKINKNKELNDLTVKQNNRLEDFRMLITPYN